uniref:Uncharacterized protein n=1 Tax=Trichuris muris TaxID=70415 RepID=A0A5S6QKV6_TRIMR
MVRRWAPASPEGREAFQRRRAGRTPARVASKNAPTNRIDRSLFGANRSSDFIAACRNFSKQKGKESGAPTMLCEESISQWERCIAKRSNGSEGSPLWKTLPWEEALSAVGCTWAFCCLPRAFSPNRSANGFAIECATILRSPIRRSKGRMGPAVSWQAVYDVLARPN